jgi:hypothetical protein
MIASNLLSVCFLGGVAEWIVLHLVHSILRGAHVCVTNAVGTESRQVQFPMGDWFPCAEGTNCELVGNGLGRRIEDDGSSYWIGPQQNDWPRSSRHVVVGRLVTIPRKVANDSSTRQIEEQYV